LGRQVGREPHHRDDVVLHWAVDDDIVELFIDGTHGGPTTSSLPGE
jgi:hypothetical protein